MKKKQEICSLASLPYEILFLIVSKLPIDEIFNLAVIDKAIHSIFLDHFGVFQCLKGEVKVKSLGFLDAVFKKKCSPDQAIHWYLWAKEQCQTSIEDSILCVKQKNANNLEDILKLFGFKIKVKIEEFVHSKKTFIIHDDGRDKKISGLLPTRRYQKILKFFVSPYGAIYLFDKLKASIPRLILEPFSNSHPDENFIQALISIFTDDYQVVSAKKVISDLEKKFFILESDWREKYREFLKMEHHQETIFFKNLGYFVKALSKGYPPSLFEFSDLVSFNFTQFSDRLRLHSCPNLTRCLNINESLMSLPEGEVFYDNLLKFLSQARKDEESIRDVPISVLYLDAQKYDALSQDDFFLFNKKYIKIDSNDCCWLGKSSQFLLDKKIIHLEKDKAFFSKRRCATYSDVSHLIALLKKGNLSQQNTQHQGFFNHNLPPYLSGQDQIYPPTPFPYDVHPQLGSIILQQNLASQDNTYPFFQNNNSQDVGSPGDFSINNFNKN